MMLVFKQMLVGFVIVISLVLVGCSYDENESLEAKNAEGSSMEESIDKKAAEEKVLSIVSGATEWEPLPDSERTEPLDFFRPLESTSGRIRQKIVEIEITQSEFKADSGKLDLRLVDEKYYLDGTVERSNDWVTVWVEKRGEEWLVVNVQTSV